MRKTVSAIRLEDGKSCFFTFNEVNECPICKRKIAPRYLFSVLDIDNELGHVLNLCTGCNSCFLSTYNVIIDFNNDDCTEFEFMFSEPQKYVTKEFSQDIATLSSEFVTIYNQALAAESASLDHIAGLGYRKSLEFLIKDYAISEHTADEDKIKSMPLAKCISTYIEDQRIKTLATRSAWLGNDEAHYERKHEDRDVSDMKRFIEAIVNYISMNLITKDAETIEAK